jgi:hypothetical protein
MFIKDLKDCEEFIAGDNTILRELLHPAKADLTSLQPGACGREARHLVFLCIADPAWRKEDEEVL